jgi:hypothetical protein
MLTPAQENVEWMCCRAGALLNGIFSVVQLNFELADCPLSLRGRVGTSQGVGCFCKPLKRQQLRSVGARTEMLMLRWRNDVCRGSRRLVTFLASPRQRSFGGDLPLSEANKVTSEPKVTKRRRSPIRHLFEVPCVARQVRRLRNSHDPLRVHVLKQSSPTSPDLPPLLGGGKGEEKYALRSCGFEVNLRNKLEVICFGQ